MEEGNNT